MTAPSAIAGSFHVAVFTLGTWRLFLAAGSSVVGFRRAAWNRVQQLAAADTLLCYVVDGHGFVAVARVDGTPYLDTTESIWHTDQFPCRVPVRTLYCISSDRAVSLPSLLDDLPRVKRANDQQAGAWGNFVRGSPRKWPAEEAQVVVDAVRARRSFEPS